MALELTPRSRRLIERLVAQYPTRQAALLPVLHVVQDQFGYLPDEALDLVAQTLELPASHVYGTVTFYTMFRRKPHGRTEIAVCTNVSCMLRGAYDVLHQIEGRLGIKPGETTSDGAFTLIEEECLAACANAPMAWVDGDYHLDLTPAKMDDLIDELKRRDPELKQREAEAVGRAPAESPPPSEKPEVH